MSRPHCDKPTACDAKGAGHCRRCACTAMRADPIAQERRREAIRANFSDPAYRAAHIERATRNVSKAWDTPEKRAALAEHMRTIQPASQMPQARERYLASRAAAGRAHSARRLAHIPPEYRELYLSLTDKGLTAAEREAVVRAEMERNTPQAIARREIAEFNARQRARAERERRDAY